MKWLCALTLSSILLFCSKNIALAASSRDVVISEIGWSGTAASTSDEWLELYNNTSGSIDLTGWTLVATDGSPSITLSGSIASSSYFLLERTADTTISTITADQIYSGALGDSGESLQLKDASGNVIDTANTDGGGWPAGTGSTGTPIRGSMERVSLTSADTDSNWVTNNGTTINGSDANGNAINGTPKSTNSQGIQPTSTPTPTPTSGPTSTPTPTITPTPTPTSKPTPTPTPKNTPTPTSTIKPTPTPNEIEEQVLGTQEEVTPTPTGIVEAETASPSSSTAGWKTSALAAAFIIPGVVLMGYSAYSFFKTKDPKNENN